MQQTENKKSEGRFSSELFGWGESLMAVLVFFVVVFTFFVRLIGVDGMSMYPTLEDHSIMLVSNLNYTPERGDVVVLRKEGFYNNQPIVKRIIATGGDTVDIDPVTGRNLIHIRVAGHLRNACVHDLTDRIHLLDILRHLPTGLCHMSGIPLNIHITSPFQNR